MNTFTFHTRWAECIRGLPCEIKAEIYDAIVIYVSEGIEIELKPMARVAFSLIKAEIDEDIREPEAETKPSKKESVDYDKLVDFFNATTGGIFGVLQKPLGDMRRKMVRARIQQHGKKAFEEVIRKAVNSDFLRGQNGFTATFDWLIKPTNFEKVLSGNYDNKTSTTAYKGDATIGNDFTRKL